MPEAPHNFPPDLSIIVPVPDGSEPRFTDKFRSLNPIQNIELLLLDLSARSSNATNAQKLQDTIEHCSSELFLLLSAEYTFHSAVVFEVLRQAFQFEYKPPIGAVGTEVMTLQMEAGPLRSTPVAEDATVARSMKYFNHPSPTGLVSGKCLLSSPKLFRAVGGFAPELMDIDSIAADYCLRLADAGFATYIHRGVKWDFDPLAKKFPDAWAHADQKHLAARWRSHLQKATN